MSKEDKTTPTPWKILNTTGKHYTLFCKDRKGIEWAFAGISFNGTLTKPEVERAIHLIVRAVNSHDALVEACREAREFANAIIQGRLFNAEQVRNTLRQAIAKAEGQK